MDEIVVTIVLSNCIKRHFNLEEHSCLNGCFIRGWDDIPALSTVQKWAAVYRGERENPEKWFRVRVFLTLVPPMKTFIVMLCIDAGGWQTIDYKSRMRIDNILRNEPDMTTVSAWWVVTSVCHLIINLFLKSTELKKWLKLHICSMFSVHKNYKLSLCFCGV